MTAQAADPAAPETPETPAEVTSSVELDKGHEELTLRGAFTKEQLYAAVGKADDDSVPEKNVYRIIAEEGTVLPADCSALFSNFGIARYIDLSKADSSNVTNLCYDNGTGMISFQAEPISLDIP